MTVMTFRTLLRGAIAGIVLLVSALGAARAETSVSQATLSSHNIETVGFYMTTRFGAGGMAIAVPAPVVLFRDGEALKTIAALNDPAGLAAHKAVKPQSWTRWRRAGRKIELQSAAGWKPLAFTKTMNPLPKGARIAGSFRHLSGAGNLSVGGSQMVTGWSGIQFDKGGAFSAGGGVGASSEVESGNQTTRAITSAGQASRQGRYEIAGYELLLTYDNGRIERRQIVTDLSDPKGALWIDGEGYARR